MGDQAVITSMDVTDEEEIFIVGIGSSAGGLEAINGVVRNLPPNIPAAYVVCQHLSPDHKSMMSTLVGRETDLDVLDIESGVRPVANTVYITPPNYDVLLRDGRLLLSPPSTSVGAPKPSVDRFLMSAAEDVGERAVAVILSGTGSDGAYGIQAIRAAGGVNIVQDASTAKFEGMPQSSVATGCADLILSPAQIGAHLVRILSTRRDFEIFKSQENSRSPLNELLQVVQARTKVDFSEYKYSTIQRRIEHRMNAIGTEDLEEYVRHCRGNPTEVDALFRSFLISVTRFFRDAKEFKHLESVIKRLVGAAGSDAIRVWVAGCATGEEAYSVAMLFAEAFGGLEEVNRSRIQIFATDIDGNALDLARRGHYPIAAFENMSDHLLNRYFEVGAHQAAVKKQLKSLIVFSDHNICQDPPFLHLDMICCRNLLIYFDPSLQAKVFSRFHYALANDGYLFLGTSDPVSDLSVKFRPAKKGANIFAKLPLRNNGEANFPDVRMPPRPTKEMIRSQNREISFDRAMFDQLSQSLGPDALLISYDQRIVRVFGDLSRYMTLTDKSRLQFTTAVLMPKLGQEARMLSLSAIKRKERRRGVPHVLEDDKDVVVQLEAFPLSSSAFDEEFVLIVFHRNSRLDIEAKAIEYTSDEAGVIDSLQQDLNSTRDQLQNTIEELETLNEELQSSYEELQSSSEEMQATNEELETSNEELQSTNEELVTVNEELQIASSEATVLADELHAMVESIAAPLLIVDTAMQLSKASESACAMFKIDRPFLGKHVSICQTPNGFPQFQEVFGDAMQYGRMITRSVELDTGKYTLQCAPVLDREGHTQGATMIMLQHLD